MDATAVATTIMKKLEAAWNAADGQAFGSTFAEDADFVDIRADYHKGRAAVAAGHQGVLDTIYRGSTNRYELLFARELAPGVLSAQVGATLNVPSGPMAGENRAVFTFVAHEANGAWLIDIFHNTLVPPQMGRPG